VKPLQDRNLNVAKSIGNAFSMGVQLEERNRIKVVNNLGGKAGSIPNMRVLTIIYQLPNEIGF